MNDSKASSTSIQVMSRMFSLLDTLAHGQEAVSLKYISAQTGLHPSTAHRILNDLAAGKYVERAGPGSYRLGLRLLELGNLVKARLDLREQASKHMQDLHQLLGLPVSLFARQDHESVWLARTSQERQGVAVQRVTGTRACLVDNIVGRTMLDKVSLTQLNLLCQQRGVRIEAVTLDLQQLRQNAYLQGRDELQATHQDWIAAPIFNDMGEAIGAMALQGVLPDQASSALVQACALVSAHMGWSGGNPLN